MSSSVVRANDFRSLLHGIPIVLKDAIETTGTSTTAESAIFEDRVATADAHVALPARGGAVIFPMANLAEFSLTHTGVTSHFGPVHNPWVLDRVPEGSSNGQAGTLHYDS